MQHHVRTSAGNAAPSAFRLSRERRSHRCCSPVHACAGRSMLLVMDSCSGPEESSEESGWVTARCSGQQNRRSPGRSFIRPLQKKRTAERYATCRKNRSRRFPPSRHTPASGSYPVHLTAPHARRQLLTVQQPPQISPARNWIRRKPGSRGWKNSLLRRDAQPSIPQAPLCLPARNKLPRRRAVCSPAQGAPGNHRQLTCPYSSPHSLRSWCHL